jgi:hypothetical protein
MSNINFREDIDNIEWEEIYPNVVVYRNMLSDPEKAYEVMNKSESSSEGKYYFNKWDPWSIFGTYSQAKFGSELDSAEKNETFNEEKSLDDEVSLAYDRAISHYVKKYNIQLPEDAGFSGRSYCKYFNKIDDLKNNMTMQYHTDYIISERDMPGRKFNITCTFYVNDNYNGGDIEFWINGDVVNHKPKAGDLVVFPSTAPYYHGVKTIPDGNKFFVRNFVMVDYDGSPEWLANQKKFGAYKWSKMEWERIEEENKANMLYINEGKKLTYEEMLRLKEGKASSNE